MVKRSTVLGAAVVAAGIMAAACDSLLGIADHGVSSVADGSTAEGGILRETDAGPSPKLTCNGGSGIVLDSGACEPICVFNDASFSGSANSSACGFGN